MLSNIKEEELTEENLLNCINTQLTEYGYKNIGMNNVIYNTGIDSLDLMVLTLILGEKFKEIDTQVLDKLNMTKCKVIDLYDKAKEQK